MSSGEKLMASPIKKVVRNSDLPEPEVPQQSHVDHALAHVSPKGEFFFPFHPIIDAIDLLGSACAQRSEIFKSSTVSTRYCSSKLKRSGMAFFLLPYALSWTFDEERPQSFLYFQVEDRVYILCLNEVHYLESKHLLVDF